MYKPTKILSTLSAMTASMTVETMLSHPEIFDPLPSTPRMSGSEFRNDPDREKTPSDLAHLEAARLKRERKQKKKDEQKQKNKS